MKRLLTPLFLTLLLSGCATYSQLFVNADGQFMRCSATGQGIIGMAVASNSVTDCNSNMRAAGYFEIERAGTIGVMLSDSGEDSHPRILRVVESSPAWRAGIDPDDLIVQVEGQVVQTIQDAQVLLFGLAGTPVTVQLHRGDFDTTFTLTRASYKSVFGQTPELTR